LFFLPYYPYSELIIKLSEELFSGLNKYLILIDCGHYIVAFTFIGVGTVFLL